MCPVTLLKWKTKPTAIPHLFGWEKVHSFQIHQNDDVLELMNKL